MRQTFVANRLGKIGGLTNTHEWRYTPSKLNPADDATRWSDNALRSDDRWFTGPEFLLRPCPEWPRERPIGSNEKESIDKLELRREYACVVTSISTVVPLTIRLLGWPGLLVVARRIRSIANHWQKKMSRKENNATTEVLENYWYREIQSMCFTEELELLRKGKSVRRGSKIIGLNPFIDKRGLLRAQGRVTTVLEGHFENYPIILDAKHFAIKYLLIDYHRRLLHAGSEVVIVGDPLSHRCTILLSSIMSSTYKTRNAIDPSFLQVNKHVSCISLCNLSLFTSSVNR